MIAIPIRPGAVIAATNFATLSATPVTNEPESAPMIRWIRMIASKARKPISTNSRR